MNTTALKTTATYGGPAVFCAGLAMFAVAIVGAGGSRPIAEASPGPTETVTAAPAPVTRRTTVTVSVRPSASPTSERAAQAHMLAAGQAPSGRDTAAEQRPAEVTPSGPSPTPESPAHCRGTVLAVQVLRAACVSVGGSR